MKKKFNLMGALLVFLLVTINISAQIKDVATMLSGGTSDASTLFQAYLKPYANAFGADLNGGWYNTAKTHKLLGFDLTASVSAAFVPKADKEFDASTLGLSASSVSTGVSPTVAGKKTPGQTITYEENGVKIAEYKTPQGTNWGVVPAPMFQLGIGLVKETDVTVRYVPNMNVGDFGGVSMWGVGLKHSLKQYIPGIKMAPFFHLSVFLGYTKMKTNANLSFQPQFYDNVGAHYDPSITYDNQKMEMEFKGFTGNILASFDLPVVTFYGGLGISSTNANLKLTGDYPMVTLATSGPYAGSPVVEDVTDPVNIKMKSKDGSATKPRLNAGIKFKMAVITLNFDYTYANYSVVTAGLGISFR